MAFAETLTELQADDLVAIEDVLAEWDETLDVGEVTASSADDSALALLAVTTGVDFDELWLRMAAGHLMRVAALAQQVQRDGANEEFAELATDVSTASMDEATSMVEVLRS
ncbi:MAG: hypothetical protein R2705_16625 [Ilumatobacteraceae bacterium]